MRVNVNSQMLWEICLYVTKRGADITSNNFCDSSPWPKHINHTLRLMIHEMNLDCSQGVALI
jgi:hypothetical protein